MSLGKNIEKHRKRAGLSRERLSLRCKGKVSATHLVKIEKEIVKSPGIEMVQAIANALNVKLDDLVR